MLKYNSASDHKFHQGNFGRSKCMMYVEIDAVLEHDDTVGMELARVQLYVQLFIWSKHCKTNF